MEIIFWIGLFIILYTYILYAVLIWLYLKLSNRPKPRHDSSYQPTVAILVACYNEEDFIEQKIKNLLEIKYPEKLLTMAFVTDGSNDSTVDIIKNWMAKYPNRILLFHKDQRKGKQNAVDRVIGDLPSEIIVFNDCNTIINIHCLEFIIPHFSNEKVGVVTGEKKIIVKKSDEAVSSGEGLYWKYESFLKQVDSDFYSAIGSPGELFAIRKNLYEKVPSDISIEDFYLSMKIVLKGFVNIYEPRAYAEESSSLSIADEFKRKRRIASGAFMTIIKLREIYKFKHFKLLILYISHRVLRWTLAPLCLVLCLFSNLYLEGPFYNAFLAIQISLYIIAIFGFFLRKVKTRLSIFYVPFYFVFMNLALLFGLFDFLNKKNHVIWEKAKRKQS